MRDELTKERIEKIELSADSGYSVDDDDWADLIALAKIGIDALDAAKGLMDCKGYDLYPDGTMRPAHGFGEWVKAEDYDKLHATAEAAIEQRDKLAVVLKWLDASGGLGLDKHAIIREALKECGK